MAGFSDRIFPSEKESSRLCKIADNHSQISDWTVFFAPTLAGVLPCANKNISQAADYANFSIPFQIRLKYPKRLPLFMGVAIKLKIVYIIYKYDNLYLGRNHFSLENRIFCLFIFCELMMLMEHFGKIAQARFIDGVGDV